MRARLGGQRPGIRFFTIVGAIPETPVLEPAGGSETLPGLEHRASSSDVAVIMYTSGSTAAPKGCMLTHQGIVRNACLHVERLGITAEDRWFSGMPLFHAGGLVWGLTSVLVSGACLVTQEVFDAGEALDLIETERCTYHHGVDTMFIREMAHPAFHARRTRTVKIAASTGTREILQRIRDVMGIEGVVSKWGITEGYGNLTLCSPTDPLEKRIQTVRGRGCPGIDYRIVDPGSARPLPPREIGEIQVRGCAMAGYYHDAAATASIIDPDGWIHTGDLGWFDDAGYLSFARALERNDQSGRGKRGAHWSSRRSCCSTPTFGWPTSSRARMLKWVKSRCPLSCLAGGRRADR